MDPGAPLAGTRAGQRRRNGYPPQTGQGCVPRAASSFDAMLSWTDSGAAAGSPVPPYSLQVSRENWYFPRYWPLADTAAGFPEDSQAAILASVAFGADAVAPLDAGRLDDVPAPEPCPARPRWASVTGPATPSTARPWLRW